LSLDCDDLLPATGCEGFRNIYSQEKTFVDDVSIGNYNFIGAVIDNMQSSGVQNSGPYSNLEIYADPLGDSHGNNCNPTSTPGPFPLEAIFLYGLGVRGVDNVTATTTGCSTSTPVSNNNVAQMAFETSETGPFSSRSAHCEGFNTCWEIGQQQASTAGVTILDFGGQPADTAGGRSFTSSADVIDISANYNTTDVTLISTKRNLGPANTIINNQNGDTLNGSCDATVAFYAWDISGGTSTVSTTSCTVPNKIGAGGLTIGGTGTAVTPSTSDNSTKIATTAYVQGQGYAGLASPTFTGAPAAPTASAGDNSTKLATTAYVRGEAQMTFTCPVAGAGALVQYCNWTLPAAITVTGFDLAAGTAPLTCSPYATLQVWNGGGRGGQLFHHHDIGQQLLPAGDGQHECSGYALPQGESDHGGCGMRDSRGRDCSDRDLPDAELTLVSPSYQFTVLGSQLLFPT
jgi:hypothetical protein